MSNKINYFDSNDYINNTSDISYKLDKISEKLIDIENYLKINRENYLQLLQNINLVSNENKKFLNENRIMYTQALKKIEETEIQNMNEIRPIINNISKNNSLLQSNCLSSFNLSRINNKLWKQRLLINPKIQYNLNSNISSVSSLNNESLENLNNYSLNTDLSLNIIKSEFNSNDISKYNNEYIKLDENIKNNYIN